MGFNRLLPFLGSGEYARQHDDAVRADALDEALSLIVERAKELDAALEHARHCHDLYSECGYSMLFGHDCIFGGAVHVLRGAEWRGHFLGQIIDSLQRDARRIEGDASKLTHGAYFIMHHNLRKGGDPGGNGGRGRPSGPRAALGPFCALVPLALGDIFTDVDTAILHRATRDFAAANLEELGVEVPGGNDRDERIAGKIRSHVNAFRGQLETHKDDDPKPGWLFRLNALIDELDQDFPSLKSALA